MRLVLDFHCHQPVGNFGWVLRQATEDCYRPLLECLERHPGVSYVWHASGPLLEWWSEEAPEVLELLERAVQDGRVELQCAGMYEPILPAIPAADRRLQIAWHQDWLRQRFGVEATSLWLTERVWEPSLARDLSLAGIQVVPMDDHHFLGAGLRGADLHRVWMTEDEGHAVRVVPTATRLRYLIPFRPVAEVRDWLRDQADQGRTMVVFGDDGEKFGVWPGTRDWVFEEGWLEEFLTMLDVEQEWLGTVTLQELCREEVPAGRIYLPTSSYPEMDRWCLPPATQQALGDWEARLDEAELREAGRGAIRGAPWRNMLARYPESNRMHKRMLQVSNRLQEWESGGDPPPAPEAVEEARRALFRGQCNCAYWHGVFGGLYLPFLREAVVANLLRARGRIDGPAPSRRILQDVDADGQDEVVLERDGWSLWVAPHRGGMVEVLDLLPLGKDLVHTMGRRAEAYHQELREQASEDPDHEDAGGPSSIHDAAGVFSPRHEDLFTYDRWPRGGFALFLCGPDQELPAPGQEPEHGFVSGFQVAEDLGREGAVELHASWEQPGPLLVRRSYDIQDQVLVVQVALECASTEPVQGRFLLRSDLSIPCVGSAERFVEDPSGAHLDPTDSAAWQGSTFAVQEEQGRLTIESSRSLEHWMEPRWLASRGEAGAEESWQGLALGMHGEFDVRENQPWTLTLRVQWRGNPS